MEPSSNRTVHGPSYRDENITEMRTPPLKSVHNYNVPLFSVVFMYWIGYAHTNWG